MNQPTSQRHTALWIDHREGKIFQIDAEGFELSKLGAPHHHLTRKADEQGKHIDPHEFYGALAASLKATEGLLVVGPSSAKLEFIRYLHRHDPALEAKVLGVETMDHPSDGQLVAYVRHYFEAADRKAGNAP